MKKAKKASPPPSTSISTWIYVVSAVFLGVACYLSMGLISFSSQRPHEEGDFRLVALPGKGAGLVATKFIPKGHRVLTEVPLFTAPSSTSDDPATLIGTLVDKLNDTQKAAFFALSSHAKRGLDSNDKEQLAMAIFETNAIMAGSQAGIFPRTARLNHGCSRAFNVVYNWREEGFLVVHAIRDIQVGEELLTTYTDTKRPRADRQAYLADAYNFDCACDVCSLEPGLSKASDARLVLMAELKAKFAAWGFDKNMEGAKAVELVKEWWRVGEEEGYHSERGQMAADVVHVAASHSDAAAATQWAKLAEEWYASELGSDSLQAGLMRQIAVRPESHWTWGTRKKMVVGGPQGILKS